MPVTDVTKDFDNRTIVITAEFAAPPERVWAIYADPRQLERVWGPPTHPATVVDHDLTPGGRVTYFMTGPEGEKYHGYWIVTAVDGPRSFTYDDGFADEDFQPVDHLPLSHVTMQFEATESGTKATMSTLYDRVEDLEQVVSMGVEEGATSAINQIDDLLLEG